jgi:hypothetical protein
MGIRSTMLSPSCLIRSVETVSVDLFVSAILHGLLLHKITCFPESSMTINRPLTTSKAVVHCADISIKPILL